MPHEINIPKDLGIDFEVEETGETYLENALLKAHALFKRTKGQAVISDDSGLSVPAIGGAPGLYSARYGSKESGSNLSSQERNALLLKKTSHLTGEERRAFFVCCMVLILDTYRIFTVQETFCGYLTTSPRGTGGFGYDPIFFLPEYQCSVAEITADEKNAISHRGRAGKRIKHLLDHISSNP